MMTQPDNKRIIVMMAFDLDTETMWTIRGDGSHDYTTNLSRGAYGPKQGAPRILDILDMYGVKATFFIPGVITEYYPLVTKKISRRGHEIGFHGYLHEGSIAISYKEEDVTMTYHEAIIRNLAGQSTAGHRGPDDIVHDCSLRLFPEHGYLYSFSWRDSDGLLIHTIDGRQVPLVEFPKDSTFDDTAYDFYTGSVPERYKLKSPREMLEIWKDKFDSPAVEGRTINFVLHPQFIGHANRVNMLNELIGCILSHGAWINTNRIVTEYMLENRDLPKLDR